jgi:cytochrome c peroxidase
MKWLLPWLFASLAAISAACSPAHGAAPQATCLEGVSSEDCEKLRAIVLPDSLPPARGNEHADEFSAALLGFHIFFDSRFSKNLNVRCESCHSVDYGFADNQAVPVAGLGPGVRNAPTVFNAARYATFLWDGRADTLWSQPLFAFENPAEMDFTRLEIVHLLNKLYTKEYVAAFSELPDFSDLSRFPARGVPGDVAYDAMSDEDKDTVNSVVANVGKALEAYLRKIATGPSLVDHYLRKMFPAPEDGLDAGVPPANTAPVEVAQLSPEQERGMAVFARSGCLECHGGPQLSDNQFHNLGVPASPGQALDLGRSEAAIAILQENPFNAAGAFFDGPRGDAPRVTPAVVGGFRTPSLRNLPKSAPYGHNGSFATLGDVVDFHLRGGGDDPTAFSGTLDPLLKPVNVSSEDRAALIEFLTGLAGSYPALPWGQWPAGNG